MLVLLNSKKTEFTPFTKEPERQLLEFLAKSADRIPGGAGDTKQK